MLLLLSACKPDERPVPLLIYTTDATLPAFVDTIGDSRILAVQTDDPATAAAGSKADYRVAVTVDASACDECFTLDEADGVYTVTGGAPLGIRYGLGALLEAFGYRFHHPTDTWMPDTLEPPDTTDFGAEQSPQIARRGIHLHTLHPIDGLYEFWTGEEPARAAATIDWAVRNRANYLEWVALDDITDSPSRLAEWQEDTAALVARTHEAGLGAGLGIQLFGTSNLQEAFDLVDSPGDPDAMRATMETRMGSIVSAADWDVVNLSFGEFSGVEPADFIAATDMARDVLRQADPDVEMTATIHVGNQDDLRVEYNGEELLYYFLVKYADPTITPWVHTVMYFDLEESAGGAYGHEEFDEHRAFLTERLAAGEPVGYFPETAYWVAFDDSVPTYLPLYMRSRWTDLAAFPTLQDHILFSSGWEWGYWQNDVAALRMSWQTPDDWHDTVDWMFAPIDPTLPDTVTALAEAEHTWLMDGRLAAYLAGRDDFIDLGDHLGIVAAPDRPGFDEVQAMDPAESAALVASLDGMAAAFAAIPAPTGPDRWSAEVADGLAVTTLRAQFIAALYGAAADPTAVTTRLAAADAALVSAQEVVARRDANLHDDLDGRLTVPGENPSIYQFGYLYRAAELCYWERERAQADNLLLGTDEDVPGCAL